MVSPICQHFLQVLMFRLDGKITGRIVLDMTKP